MSRHELLALNLVSPHELARLKRALAARLPVAGAWRRRAALARLAELREDPAVVPFLLEAAAHPHAPTAARARDALCRIESPQASDALCEAAVRDPRGLAAEICRATGRRPSDHDRACLFLFVTRQLDRYFAEDDDFQSLRLEYERAAEPLRDEILRVVRSGDRRSLGFFGTRKRLAECAEAEIFLALQFFRKHDDWPRLFQAFLELPLKYGFLILRELDRAGWRPPAAEERILLERCLALARDHLTAPASANRVPGALFGSLLERGRRPPYTAWSEERLIERLARASPLEGVSLASAIGARRTPSTAGLRAIEENPHWLVRLAGRLLGLAVDPTRVATDERNYWSRTVAPPSPILEFWPEKGSPAHLDALAAAAADVAGGPFAPAREVLRLLLAHRITAGEFEELELDSGAFSGAFEPACESLEELADAWTAGGGEGSR